MCNCHLAKCDPRCPNAKDPPTAYVCALCGEPVVNGEEYAELDGEFYHRECFEEAAVDILLDKFGARKGVARSSNAH